MTTTVTNHSKRQARPSLAWQLDRLDGILDGLADALNESVAAAVQETVEATVRETVQTVLADVLRNPELLAHRSNRPDDANATPAPQPLVHIKDCVIWLGPQP